MKPSGSQVARLQTALRIEFALEYPRAVAGIVTKKLALLNLLPTIYDPRGQRIPIGKIPAEKLFGLVELCRIEFLARRARTLIC